MEIHRSLARRDVNAALFGTREEGVQPETLWETDYAEVGRMHQAIGGDGLVLFDQGKLARVNLDTGECQWQIACEERPSTAMAYDGGLTLVSYEDGTLAGIDKRGTVAWKHEGDRPCHVAPGGPDLTMVFYETQPDHKLIHMGIEPATGKVLWQGEGATYDRGVECGPGVRALKASHHLLCVEPSSGTVVDQLKFRNYGRDLVGSPNGTVWFLDDNSVRKVQLEGGKLLERWDNPAPDKPCALMGGPGVLYLTIQDKVLGLDPETGKERFSVPIDGESYSTMMVVDERGALLVPRNNGLVSVSPDGGVWQADIPGLSRVRQTERGLVALSDPGHPEGYRLSLLRPDTGGTVLWAEIPRQGSIPWLDSKGRVLQTFEDRIEMRELPDPATLPPEGGKVVLESPSAVIVGGVVVRKRKC